MFLFPTISARMGFACLRRGNVTQTTIVVTAVTRVWQLIVTTTLVTATTSSATITSASHCGGDATETMIAGDKMRIHSFSH